MNKQRPITQTQLDFRKVSIEKKMHCTGHRASVYALDHGDVAGSILSAGGDGLVVRWLPQSPDTGQVIARVDSNVFAMKYLPALHRLAIGNMYGGVHWINLHDNENIRNVAHHEKGVFAMEWINGHLYSLGGQGRLAKWDAEACRVVETVQLSHKSLRGLAYHAERRELAIGSSDYSIYILDADSLAVKRHLADAHTNSVFAVAYSPDGRYLLSGGRDAHLRVWDLEADMRLVSEQPAHWFTINKIAFAPDGRTFATASRDKSIKLWDAATYKLLKVIAKVRYAGHTHSVNDLLWTPQEGWLVSASDDRQLMGWEVTYKGQID